MNVIDTAFMRHFDGSVGGTVVDDEELNAAEPAHLPRKTCERFGQRRLLIVARNLYDELHGVPD